MSGKPILAVGAIVKNEFPYLLEWIAFHKLQGVTRFFIAENDSSDCTADLLQALDAIGEVTLIQFPSIAGVPSQLRAYSFILERFSSEFDWVAFIDADEFIVPDQAHDRFIDWLSSVPDDVGGVALNWAIYGSSGHERFSPALTIDRFQRRADKSFHLNHHFKSVISNRASPAAPETPHRFKLPNGLKFIHTDMSSVEDHRKHGRKVSDAIVWERFKLNHYNIRSHEEFFDRKASRGLADSKRVRDNIAFFAERDRNEVIDVVAPDLRDRVAQEISYITDRLAQNCYIYGDAGAVSDQAITASAIDHFLVMDGLVTLIGWAYYVSNHQPVKNIKVLIKGVEARTQMLRKPTHPAVTATIGNLVSCGFDIAAASIGSQPTASDVEVRLYDERFERYDLIKITSVAVTGYVDNMVVRGAVTEIHGWYFVESDNPAREEISVKLGSRIIEVREIVRIDRRDVQSRHPAAPSMCGFIAYVPSEDPAQILADAEVVVTAGYASISLKRTKKVNEKIERILADI